jgi:hypothetical protein
LIQALWRVFYFSVEQWVGETNPLLGKALLAQQCAIIDAMISRRVIYRSVLTDESKSTPDRISSFMGMHACRWQATIFLLCDCLSISPALFTPERIEFIKQLGAYAEWEGTIAHDINRVHRDSEEYGPNVYIMWLDSEEATHSEASVARFLDLVNKESLARRDRILAAVEDSEFFDADHFLKCVRHVRQEYHITPLPADSP